MNHNFNTTLTLWEAYRKACHGTKLAIDDGHVFEEADYEWMNCIARFDDDNHARETLLKAGYRETSKLHFEA